MVVSVRTSSAAVVHVFSLEAHPADWEVLEPSSSVLQTDARVSQEENTGVSATSPSARENVGNRYEKTRCHFCGNTGFANVASSVRPSVTCVWDAPNQNCMGAHSRFAARSLSCNLDNVRYSAVWKS